MSAYATPSIQARVIRNMNECEIIVEDNIDDCLHKRHRRIVPYAISGEANTPETLPARSLHVLEATAPCAMSA
jgi:hypothetical protein